MTVTPLFLAALLVFAFVFGITCTFAALMCIEKRVMRRPGIRVELARRFLGGGAS